MAKWPFTGRGATRVTGVSAETPTGQTTAVPNAVVESLERQGRQPIMVDGRVQVNNNGVVKTRK